MRVARRSDDRSCGMYLALFFLFNFLVLKILPSGHIVDRSNIARHLLTSQTDPYTRLELTQDQLKPDVELKDKIRQWRADKKK